MTSTMAPVALSPVDAGGVPAEWVEVAPATIGQATVLYLAPPGGEPDPLTAGRAVAARLAASTGARVLSVGCRPNQKPPAPDAAIDDGVDAYAWLLDEGCDVETTTFVSDPARTRATEVLHAARRRGLPVPGGGARSV